MSEISSSGALPNDLETARVIIESLTRQLKIHDDVTSNLILLQKRIQHTHQKTKDAIHMLKNRLDNIEATWTKELENQHKCWLNKYNRLMKEAENTRILNKVTPSGSAKRTSDSAKISKQQIEGFNRRIVKINEGIGELKKVADSTKNFDEKLLLDKQKIRDIDARLKALTKREQKLNAELNKQMNVHFRKPFVQMPEEQTEQNFYGVCEIIVGYQKTIENLDKALRKLEEIRNVSVMKNIKSTIQNTPSIDEIDEITVLMKCFVARLRVQLASIHSGDNSALNPMLRSSKSVSLTNFSNNLKSQNLKETTTSFGDPSKYNTSSGFGTTPLNTSQPISTGSSSSSTHSQFLALKSEISSEEMTTAKEKSDQI
ncbi:unnamed protein product [Onchocerca flexuosa]|uniref:Uncharacterized protein n=1 Tax=Onchocerca flexuosa TaxID=387005 RepID=A0A183HYH1_9BILA|nr:unnamed protein product [Onchocerca flexuosa]